MTMSPRFSKIVLTSHITFSVGWLCAVAVFLALAIIGTSSQSVQLARASYIAMEVSSWYIIVPFCIAALLTGIVQSLGTNWGLFKHYWIVVKLILTIASTILLLLHLKPISLLSDIALDTKLTVIEMPGLQMQVIADASAAFLLLLAITTISVYKPWGRISYTFGNKYQQKVNDISSNKNSLGKYILIGLGLLIVVFIIKHLLSGGMHSH